jgi:hypothetical protein
MKPRWSNVVVLLAFLIGAFLSYEYSVEVVAGTNARQAQDVSGLAPQPGWVETGYSLSTD